MGKLILFLVGAIIMAGFYYSTGEKRAQYDTTVKLAADEFEVLARNAAVMGIERAEQQLADDFANKTTIRGTYEGGSYETRMVAKGTDGVVVNSSASVTHRNGETVTFDIRAEYERENWFKIADAPPAFMQYMLMGGVSISLQGNVKGHKYVAPDGSSAPANADLHTNGLLKMIGNTADIEGFGTYGLAVLPSQAWAERAFTPGSNPTNSPTAYRSSTVSIPSLSPSLMATSMVVDSTSLGNALISSVNDLPTEIGTREKPYIWHVPGNLTINSDVEIPGYTMILVDGILSIDGDVKTPQTSYDGADESTLAFYVGGVAKVAGNTEIWAQIFSNSVLIEARGTPKLYGSIITPGTISLGGSVDYYYRGASPALTTYFQGGTNDRLVRVSYSEW